MRITDYDIGLRNYFDNVFYSADGEGGSSRGEEDRREGEHKPVRTPIRIIEKLYLTKAVRRQVEEKKSTYKDY